MKKKSTEKKIDRKKQIKNSEQQNMKQTKMLTNIDPIICYNNFFFKHQRNSVTK